MLLVSWAVPVAAGNAAPDLETGLPLETCDRAVGLATVL